MYDFSQKWLTSEEREELGLISNNSHVSTKKDGKSHASTKKLGAKSDRKIKKKSKEGEEQE